MFKKAFTLAELIIVLGVIAVLVSILVPIAFKNTPDEDVVRFKNTHHAFVSAISAMASSDEFLPGDISMLPTGEPINDACYFINALAQKLNAKNKFCKVMSVVGSCEPDGAWSCAYSNTSELEDYKEKLGDNTSGNNFSYGQIITTATVRGGGLITLQNGMTLIIAQPNPGYCTDASGNVVSTHGKLGTLPICHDQNGFDTSFGHALMLFDYKLVQEDKGLQVKDYTNIFNNYKKAIFAYSFRTDGKIITNKVVDEWLQRSVKRGD